MTKQQAIRAMLQGHKVAHTYFSDDEWISDTAVNPNYYTDEMGLLLNKDDFWQHRPQEYWQSGWRIVE